MKDLTHPEVVYQLLYPELAREFPPLRSLDVWPNNLPTQLTSFVGREHELAEVRRLLGTTRLLTLAGAGGAGKTRLALQLAAGVLETFPDGVWWVELAPLADARLVTQAVATAVRVREEPGRPLLAALTEQLRPRRLLLVLDNCEHMLAGCAEVVEALLRGCLRLQILATSRGPLGIAGETTWRVPSLRLPDPEEPSVVQRMTQYDAVRLFIARAVATRPDFAVTNASAPAVAQICWRLDGMPLAIELAAARVNVLAPQQIAAKLEDRFRLLTGGSRTASPRQQTRRATVEWSYELLSDRERCLFERLAVFAGGWTLEAAEAVCSGRGLEPGDVLDLLGQLVDKSLVLAEAAESPVRYRMLETVRQYALERLVDSREFEELNQQLAAYMTNFAESAKSGLFGPQQLSGPSGRRACTCGKDRTGWSRCLSCPHARTHSRRCVHARYSG